MKQRKQGDMENIISTENELNVAKDTRNKENSYASANKQLDMS